MTRYINKKNWRQCQYANGWSTLLYCTCIACRIAVPVNDQ